MFGYLKDYPDRLPWISGEGAQLGDAWWICVPQSEYQRLQRFERNQIEDAFFVLSFTVNIIPSEVYVHVSAINRYRLFVNGCSVSFGPRKGDIYCCYYETIDIAPYLKTGDNTQNNIFSDLNRFNNDVNAYNSNMYNNKKKLSPTYTIEKKESKFEGIKNNYFSDSYLLFKFKDEVSKNGFRRFENILLSKSVKKAVFINTALSFLLLYSIFIVSHYTKIDEDYFPYLSIKTAIILLLVIFVFLTDKLVDSFPKIKFILLTLT